MGIYQGAACEGLYISAISPGDSLTNLTTTTTASPAGI